MKFSKNWTAVFPELSLRTSVNTKAQCERVERASQGNMQSWGVPELERSINEATAKNSLGASKVTAF